MADGDFKDLNRRKVADKVLRDKAFTIVKNLKYDGYQRRLASMVYQFLDKNTYGETVKNEITTNKELTEELQKPIIRKFNKRKVYLPFIDNIWGTDLADMQLIRKCNKGFRFLLCIIDTYINYTQVIPLKDNKGITITNAFQTFQMNQNASQIIKQDMKRQ